jgi:ubiquinone/menaquinone biosynthesis C-methylase UbiE
MEIVNTCVLKIKQINWIILPFDQVAFRLLSLYRKYKINMDFFIKTYTQVCFKISKWLLRPPTERSVDYLVYEDWRVDTLAKSWAAFSDTHIMGKDVLDFGCGNGPLTFFLAKEKQPRHVLGVDIDIPSIDRAKEILSQIQLADDVDVEFKYGSTNQLPVHDQSFDTLLAFDCLEHIMEPKTIFREWYRALRPGGRCLIDWSPYKGPWGPHMNVLIPIPWAHFIFGERVMLQAAEKIYDLPDFIPRHWDLDEAGNKKPNKWRDLSSFEEQGYINKLDIPAFQALASEAGFQISRLEKHSFNGVPMKKMLGHLLMKMPIIGEYFVSYVYIELLRP